jgi:glyoxylase-like metal-dependent hydrolase (beta-lactamase superfamily II)
MLLERTMDPGWLSNAYLVGDKDGGTGVIVDSGAPLAPLLRGIERHRLRLTAILTTHRHLDHVQGHAELRRATGAPVYALASEAPHVPDALSLEAERETDWGGVRGRAVALPGHTLGHAGYLIDGAGLFTGDCLFAGSLGGTVGAGASGFEDARRAVFRILSLPDATPIHPGHAGPTSVGAERVANPFIRVLTGHEREGGGRCTALGRPGRLVVLARDYDGGTKAWVRFDDDGTDALVPGSRVLLSGAP